MSVSPYFSNCQNIVVHRRFTVAVQWYTVQYVPESLHLLQSATVLFIGWNSLASLVWIVRWLHYVLSMDCSLLGCQWACHFVSHCTHCTHIAHWTGAGVNVRVKEKMYCGRVGGKRELHGRKEIETQREEWKMDKYMCIVCGITP